MKKDYINLFFNSFYEILTEDCSIINLEEILIKEDNYLICNYPERHFERPSMQTFYNKIFVPKIPAILTGLIYIFININYKFSCDQDNDKYFVLYCNLCYKIKV